MKQVLEHFKSSGTDAFLYVGSIERSGYDGLCDILEKKPQKGQQVLLFLITTGGNPNAGYRIARALTHHYGAENFRVAVPAECKSAGTLICIGANSLVFFDRGELGPLDVQFQKQDEIFQQSSGLDILRGMTYLRTEALETFSEYLVDINGGSGLSTKVASEIASKLVIGLFEPMFAQIDPIRLGEMNAALQIANEYGNRLCESAKSLKSGALAKLINSYPTHGFVIDRAEARKLFERVAAPTEQEAALSGVALRMAAGQANRARPKVVDLLRVVESIVKTVEDDERQAAQGAPADAQPGGGVSGGPVPPTPPGAGGEQPPVPGATGNV
jgi:hypothetical protein